MLIRRIALVVLTMALGSTQATNAQATSTITGMQLQQWCSDPKPNGLDGLQCASFMLGFINGMNEADLLLDKAQKVFCLPDGLTAGQAILITNKFMGEHPEDLHRSAAAIIGRALYIAYACKRSDEAG
jgi:hypothetical protein